MTATQIDINDIDFLIERIEHITDSKEYELPSEYAERVRYLPAELTPMPGKFSFDKCPYMREILDCLSPLNQVQEIAACKGVQQMFTTGFIENGIAYNIESDPNPQLYISADKGLIEKGMQIKVERLIDSCNLRKLIFSQTAKKRNTGDTKLEKEYPGGFLHGIGARNPGKLRAMSYSRMWFDELDGFPDTLGKEGDPLSLAKKRTIAYGSKKKIVYISTPTILQTSKIWKLFQLGDQRYYNVPCKHCGKKQHFEWHGVTDEGKKYGIVFETNKDFLPIYETVGYKCKHCGGIMKNHDKSLIMGKGEWIPTAKSQKPNFRSYHLNSLYSPPGMFSWEDAVAEWAECWDLEKDRVKDIEKYKSFRNTIQGLPFEERGSSIKFERSIQHRRSGFALGHIPEKIMLELTGNYATLITCAVDVQGDRIIVHPIAWTPGGQSWTLDFFGIDGDVTNVKSDLWKQLEKFIDEKIYIGENNKAYRITATFIDSGWGKWTDIVYQFCSQYSAGVYPVKGEAVIKTGLTYKIFSKDLLDKAGLSEGYLINTTKIKDRISRYLTLLQWDTGQNQPDWYPNFPENLGDDFFRMFEAEHRVNEYEKKTNRFLRTIWKQDAGKENHAFDTFGYNLAALELIADRVCRDELKLFVLSWKDFWNYTKLIYNNEAPFYYFQK